MRIVYLLRKPTTEPTVATNALRWGAGALNIDATRIAFTDAVDPNAVHRQQTTGGVIGGAFGAAGLIGKEIPMYKPGGRWPANLILQHRPACVREGARTVKGGGHFPASRPSGSQKSGPSGHKGQSDLKEKYFTHETVPAWRCVSECPVAALDGQSGVTSSRASDADYTLSVNNNPTRVARNIKSGVHFSDTGGASRFFLTIGGQTPQPKETP